MDTVQHGWNCSRKNPLIRKETALSDEKKIIVAIDGYSSCGKSTLVSAIPAIRKRMVKKQQGYGLHKGIVMDGRDIGTTVFPAAELKIFMTARNEVRARRRFDELTVKGYTVTMEEVHRNIDSRDHQD